MRRAAAPLLFLLLASCAGAAEQQRLSFATVQTLNPGVDARWVLEEFPSARGIDRGPEGRIRRIEYGVEDPQGKRRNLVLHFDEQEVLTHKQYSGRLVRPLETDPEASRITGVPSVRR